MRYLILTMLLACGLALPAAADHHLSGGSHMQVTTLPCCQSIQGDTVEVLVAPSPEAIRRIQAELAVKGFNPGPIDGVMGPRTERALVTFQRDQGLFEGLLTVDTLSRLGLCVHGARTSCGSHHAMHVTRSHTTTDCCAVQHPRMERRVIERRVIHPAHPMPEVHPVPAAEQLPNYRARNGVDYRVDALNWTGKTSR